MAINPQSLAPFITPYASPLAAVKSQQEEYNTLATQDENKRATLAREADAARGRKTGEDYAKMQGEQYAYNRMSDARDFAQKEAAGKAAAAVAAREDEEGLLTAWLKAKQDGDLTAMQAIASLMKERAGYSMELGSAGGPASSGAQEPVSAAPLGSAQMGAGAAPPQPEQKVDFDADEYAAGGTGTGEVFDADAYKPPEKGFIDLDPDPKVADELMQASEMRDAAKPEQVIPKPLGMGRSWLANQPPKVKEGAKAAQEMMAYDQSDPSSATAALEASPGRRPPPMAPDDELPQEDVPRAGVPPVAPPSAAQQGTQEEVRPAPLSMLAPGHFRLKKGQETVAEGDMGSTSAMFQNQLQAARAAGDKYGAQAARRAQQFLEDRVAAGVPMKEAQKEALAFMEKEEDRSKGRYGNFMGKSASAPGSLAGTVGPGKKAPDTQDEADDMAIYGAVWRNGKTYDAKTGRELSAKEYESRISNAESFRTASGNDFFKYAKFYSTDRLIAEEVGLKKIADLADKIRKQPGKYAGKAIADAIGLAIKGPASDKDTENFINASYWTKLENLYAQISGTGKFSQKVVDDIMDQAAAAYENVQRAHKIAANKVAYAMKSAPSTVQAPHFVDRKAVADSSYHRAMGERDPNDSYRSPGDPEDQEEDVVNSDARQSEENPYVGPKTGQTSVGAPRQAPASPAPKGDLAARVAKLRATVVD